MEKRDVIQKVLSSVQAQGADVLNVMNGVGWMGQASGLQQQVGEAVTQWIEHDDPQPLLGIVELLQTLDNLSADEADELRHALTDLKGRSDRK
jgi:hypothetical protein